MPAKTLRRHPALALAYLSVLASGVLGFVVTPSPTLSQQGGQIILVAWGAVCVTGGFLALLGLFSHRRFVESVGGGFCAVAGLVFTTSLILQAVKMSSAVPLTAACIAGATTALFAQRWVDVFRRPES